MSGFARGVSLIENVPLGISIEYDKQTSLRTVERQVTQCLVNLGLIQGVPLFLEQERYIVYGVLNRDSESEKLILENFVETDFSGERFFPVLYGEDAYESIICLKARRG